MSNRYREIPPAFTGTSTRMQTLPSKSVSSLDNHRDLTPQPLYPCDKRINPENLIQAQPQQISRKCVYHYEDKYTFARILQSDTLIFDSHFESGNLLSAYRVLGAASEGYDRRKQQYDLYMHNDVHTRGNTQWFFFSVGNVKSGQEITFVVRNFGKSDSMFNQGLRPLMYSSNSKSPTNGWVRVGSNIQYFECPPHLASESGGISYPTPTSTPSSSSKEKDTGGGDSNNSGTDENAAEKKSAGTKKKKKKDTKVSSNSTGSPTAYSVSFTHTFDRTGDVCYFAFSHPYTYTDLQHYLHGMSLKSMVRGATILRRSVLCRTLAGNICDLLTITAPCDTAEELMSRPAIIITARVHPGETVASWIMEGVLEFLMSSSKEANSLRQKFVFKVIPMLNPDGVINGNYRTNLSGNDLNRRWHAPEPSLHPTIYHAKELIKRVKRVRPVAMVLDLHGHSRKQGIFTYGCTPDRRHLRPASPPNVMVLTREQQAQGGGGGGGMSASSSRAGLSYSPSPGPDGSSNAPSTGTGTGTGTGRGGKSMHAAISNTFLLSSSTSSHNIKEVAAVGASLHLRHGGALAADDTEEEEDVPLFAFGDGTSLQESRSVSPFAPNAPVESNSDIISSSSPAADGAFTDEYIQQMLRISSPVDTTDAGAGSTRGSPTKGVHVEYPMAANISVPNLSVCENPPPAPPAMRPVTSAAAPATAADGEFLSGMGRSPSGVLQNAQTGGQQAVNPQQGGLAPAGGSIGMTPASSAANLALLQNMLSGNANIVTVKEELPPVSTIREGIPPPKRDVLVWKARLLPRALEVYSPIFTLDNCTYKMHKSKAATMRMVTFVELGIDNVYTIECSLGGKYPNHFSAQDLIQFGNEVCNSILECHSALVAPSGAPLPSVTLIKGEVPTLEYAKRSGETSAETDPSLAGAPSMKTPGNSTFYPGQFQREIAHWTKHYEAFSSGFGSALLNVSGQRELICTVVEDGDSDDDKEYKDQGSSEGAVTNAAESNTSSNSSSTSTAGKDGKRGESSRRASSASAGGGLPRPSRVTARKKQSVVGVPQTFTPAQGSVGVVELNMDLSIGNSQSAQSARAGPIASVSSAPMTSHTPRETSRSGRENSTSARMATFSSPLAGSGGLTGPDEEYFQSLLMGSRRGGAPLNNPTLGDPAAGYTDRRKKSILAGGSSLARDRVKSLDEGLQGSPSRASIGSTSNNAAESGVIFISNAGGGAGGSGMKPQGNSGVGVGMGGTKTAASSLMIGNPTNTSAGAGTSSADPIATLKKTTIKKPAGKDPLIATETDSKGGKSTKKKGKKDADVPANITSGNSSSSSNTPRESGVGESRERENSRPKKARMKGSEGIKRPAKDAEREREREREREKERERERALRHMGMDVDVGTAAAIPTGVDWAGAGEAVADDKLNLTSSDVKPTVTPAASGDTILDSSNDAVVPGTALECDSDSDGAECLGPGISLSSPCKARKSTAMNSMSGTSGQASFHNSSYVGALSPTAKSISKPAQSQGLAQGSVSAGGASLESLDGGSGSAVLSAPQHVKYPMSLPSALTGASKVNAAASGGVFDDSHMSSSTVGQSTQVGEGFTVVSLTAVPALTIPQSQPHPQVPLSVRGQSSPRQNPHTQTVDQNVALAPGNSDHVNVVNTSLDALANAKVTPAPTVIVMPSSMSINGSGSPVPVYASGSSGKTGNAEIVASLKTKIANRGDKPIVSSEADLPPSSPTARPGQGQALTADDYLRMASSASSNTLPYYATAPDPTVYAKDVKFGSGNSSQALSSSPILSDIRRDSIGDTTSSSAASSAVSGKLRSSVDSDVPLMKIPSMSVQVQVRGKGGSIIVSDSSGMNDPLAHSHAVALSASQQQRQQQQQQQQPHQSRQLQAQFEFPGPDAPPQSHQSQIQGLLLTPNHNFHQPQYQQPQQQQGSQQGTGAGAGAGTGIGIGAGIGNDSSKSSSTGAPLGSHYFNHQKHRTGV